jgi:hypothetical protein
VAAPPAAGEAAPVIFETERELVATAAALTSLVVHDPKQDRYVDRSAVLITLEPSGVPIFDVGADSQPVANWFYLGHSELLGLPHLTEVRLTFTGIIGQSYFIQRAPAVTGPWSYLATVTPTLERLIEYIDVARPLSAGFYRTATP